MIEKEISNQCSFKSFKEYIWALERQMLKIKIMKTFVIEKLFVFIFRVVDK